MHHEHHGIITNTATITGNQYDPNPENNQDNATVVVYDGLSVINVDPADGSVGVNQNKQIVLTFNEDIQPGSNYKGITVRNAATGQGYTLTKSIVGNQLFLSGKWTPGVTFEIVIPKNAVKDLNGVQNKNSFISTFTASSGPSVVSFDPANGAINVASDQQIVITFNETIQAGTNYNGITVRNTATGQGYTISKNIVGNQLFITGNWTPGTVFEIVIPKNAVKDSNGNGNANIYTSTSQQQHLLTPK
jgi:methionine-rich copper-binding protein CopC